MGGMEDLVVVGEGRLFERACLGMQDSIHQMQMCVLGSVLVDSRLRFEVGVRLGVGFGFGG